MPVLPIDTLLTVAEEARQQSQSQHPNSPTDGDGAINITALLDARMDEMYVQRFACHQSVLTKIGNCQLIRPEHMMAESNSLYAGNVFEVYRSRLPEGLNSVTCLPSATAMLRLAPRLAASGLCLPADQALPLYVRDKVAQTTQEREKIKALKLQAI